MLCLMWNRPDQASILKEPVKSTFNWSEDNCPRIELKYFDRACNWLAFLFTTSLSRRLMATEWVRPGSLLVYAMHCTLHWVLASQTSSHFVRKHSQWSWFTANSPSPGDSKAIKMVTRELAFSWIELLENSDSCLWSKISLDLVS